MNSDISQLLLLLFYYPGTACSAPTPTAGPIGTGTGLCENCKGSGDACQAGELCCAGACPAGGGNCP